MYNNEAIYIKLPADIKVESLNGNRNYRILEPFDWGKFNVQTDLEHLSCFPHFANETPLRDVNGYISMPKLINSYLLCDTEITGTDIKQPNEIFEYEERTGLKIDSGLHVAEEGMVYTIQVIRLRDRFSLYASAENISALAERGFIKFGGMNRVCEYEILDNDPLKKYYDQKEKEIKNLVSKTKIFKMLFLTPAVFNGGWWFNSNNYEINFNGLKFKLLSAVINKPLFISGWDLANNKPKPLKKVVPEGSVYYFELIEGSVDDLFQKFNFVNFGDENPNLGYGLTLIGGIKNV
jgi:CRISPR-associated protein Cmr3